MIGLSDAAAVPESIRAAVAAIARLERVWGERAAARQAQLTMPPGSLGRLLELGQQLAMLQGTDRPEGRPALIAVLAADHGVTDERVSAYPSAVTGQMVANYLRGGAAVNVLARNAGAAVRVADLGVKHWAEGIASHGALVRCPVGPGTRNFLRGPAMSRAEAFQAVETGLRLADHWIDETAARVVALGEMGIGNSTTAAALIAALTGASAEAVVGRGAGVDDVGLARKRDVVAKAVRLHVEDVRDDLGRFRSGSECEFGRARLLPSLPNRRSRSPARQEPRPPGEDGSALRDDWDLLARLGGFEILGLSGLALGAARRGALVVLDGLISSCAGLIATRLCPALRDYLVAAHRGPEPGHGVALDALRLSPLLSLDLRLGEGSGAALALPIIAAAADILRDMATFDSAGVSGPSAAATQASLCNSAD